MRMSAGRVGLRLLLLEMLLLNKLVLKQMEINEEQ
jgi:hypothetical protein